MPALGILGSSACGECCIVDREVDCPIRDVDFDEITLLDEADEAAFGRFWRDVANGEARRAAREATICQKRAGCAEAFDLR